MKRVFKEVFGDQPVGCAMVTAVCLISFVLLTIKLCGGANFEYSTGSRSGIVQKISRKGIIWKTWEGEMNLGYLKSTPLETGAKIDTAIFHFSVSDPKVVEQVQRAEQEGSRVTLQYRQLILRGFADGQSMYDIINVK